MRNNTSVTNVKNAKAGGITGTSGRPWNRHGLSRAEPAQGIRNGHGLLLRMIPANDIFTQLTPGHQVGPCAVHLRIFPGIMARLVRNRLHPAQRALLADRITGGFPGLTDGGKVFIRIQISLVHSPQHPVHDKRVPLISFKGGSSGSSRFACQEPSGDWHFSGLPPDV